MTAQIEDSFRYRDKLYSLAGISEGEVFDISLLDLQPTMTCTACWRGYQAEFTVHQSRLVLETLHVNLCRPSKGEMRWEREVGPTINGVGPAAARDERDWFNNHYEKLNYHLEYTGGLLLADGFIPHLYVHMGFHPAWKYETVIELVFESGLLTQEFDRSERMAELRNLLPSSEPGASADGALSKEEIRQFVERAFDRSYER